MRKLYAKYVLWRAKFCTVHLTAKRPIVDAREGVEYVCDACDLDKRLRRADRTLWARKVLGAK